MSFFPLIKNACSKTWIVALLSCAVLAACGGAESTSADLASTAQNKQRKQTLETTAGVQKAQTGAVSVEDAVRLSQQATFGPSEELVSQIRAQGVAAWLQSQQALSVSRYVLGNGDAIHRGTLPSEYCSLPGNDVPNCWRDWFSTQPLVWDFYRNAMQKPDQLRQRVALALQQILVVNSLDVQGTYGFRAYHNMLLDLAFDNYREVLRRVTLSPLMGEFLDNVNNDSHAPNENYARELLQLFSLGTCKLNSDGSLTGGTCSPVYGNEVVRAYAQALTGWTYPAGGSTTWGCLPQGANCRYYGANMVPAAAFRDGSERVLLTGVKVPAGTPAAAALELVLDSLMKHPNIGPFVGRQFIRHLVSSNPSPAYVKRVATVFNLGTFTSGGVTFGKGKAGDLAATIAAVLLDAEARTGAASVGVEAGLLREPVLYFTGLLRALNGKTDGEALGSWWGERLHQHLFRAPSVFNFYAAEFPLMGTSLNGPAFAIHNADSALERLNFLTFLLQWGGSPPDANVPGAIGTSVSTAAFESDAANPGVLVDRLCVLATGMIFPSEARSVVVRAVESIAAQGPDWKSNRVRQAAYLVFASPQYQISR